jgi:hypothetical protein
MSRKTTTHRITDAMMIKSMNESSMLLFLLGTSFSDVIPGFSEPLRAAYLFLLRLH